MSKLATLSPVKPKSFIRTFSPQPDAVTRESALGFALDEKSELFLFAISNMVGESNFYESSTDRDARFRSLIAKVTASDPDWIRRFVPYLRNSMNMRSASIVMAVEYVIAGGPNGRGVIDSAIARADEMGEVIGYYRSRIGRSLPQPIKRGIADASVRLMSEYNFLKYGKNGSYTFGDIIRIAHPEPSSESQSDLFRFSTRGGEQIPPSLETLVANAELLALPLDERRAVLQDPDRLNKAGMTWESLSGWIQGSMDKEAWEAIIPSMGYMALIRNLRNFEQAGVGGETRDRIIARISDPEQVAKSRQFPFRFYSAYRNTSDFGYKGALQTALDLSTQNVPELKGNTLIVIDASGSMEGATYSKRGSLKYAEQAFLFGATLGKKNVGSVDMYQYSADVGPRIDLSRRALLEIVDKRPTMGTATNTHASIKKVYKNHDRVVVFTDMQSSDSPSLVSHITVPIYTFNVAGYPVSDRSSGSDNRYIFGGGLTDAAFRMIPLIESGKSADWPF